MIETCRQFLRNQLLGLLLPDSSSAYGANSIFFKTIPRDWLKDDDYGALCLVAYDRKKRDGQMIGRQRNPEMTHYVITRRTYKRRVLYRCVLHANRFEDLWGETGFTGMVDQFDQEVSSYRCIADPDNNSIFVSLHDAMRPFDEQVKKERIKRRAYKAILRVEFNGGIYATDQIPIIQDVDLADGVTTGDAG